MTDQPLTLPTPVVRALMAIDDELRPQRHADGYVAGTGPLSTGLGEQLIDLVTELGRYAGPAMAAPLVEPADALNRSLARAEADLAIAQDDRRQLGNTAHRRGDLLDDARTALLTLGAAYAERDYEAIQAEQTVAALIDVIDQLPATATDRQRRNRVLNARKLAADRTRNIVAEELAANDAVTYPRP